jgi:hypothetical protein
MLHHSPRHPDMELGDLATVPKRRSSHWCAMCYFARNCAFNQRVEYIG